MTRRRFLEARARERARLPAPGARSTRRGAARGRRDGAACWRRHRPGHPPAGAARARRRARRRARACCPPAIEDAGAAACAIGAGTHAGGRCRGRADAASATPRSRRRPGCAASPQLRARRHRGAATSPSTCAAGTTATPTCAAGCTAATPATRRSATTGSTALEAGDCISVAPSDLAAALVALDATRRASAGRPASAALPLLDLYARPSDDASLGGRLAPGELIAGVELPAAAGGLGLRARRRARGVVVRPRRRRRGTRGGERCAWWRSASRTSRACSTPPIRCAGLDGLEQTGWKRELLAALCERALAAIA